MRPNRSAQSRLKILSDSGLKLFDFWELAIVEIIQAAGFQSKNYVDSQENSSILLEYKKRVVQKLIHTTPHLLCLVFSPLQCKHSALAKTAREVASINALNARFMLVDNCFHYSLHHTVRTIRVTLQCCIEQLGAHVGVQVPVASDVESFVLCHM